MNTSQFRKFAQIWSNMTSFLPKFLIIIKFDGCHRCQHTELPLVVNFQAKGVNTSEFRKFAQISPNLVQNNVILTQMFDNYQI